jgi:hypothetical protein
VTSRPSFLGVRDGPKIQRVSMESGRGGRSRDETRPSSPSISKDFRPPTGGDSRSRGSFQSAGHVTGVNGRGRGGATRGGARGGRGGRGGRGSKIGSGARRGGGRGVGHANPYISSPERMEYLESLEQENIGFDRAYIPGEVTKESISQFLPGILTSENGHLQMVESAITKATRRETGEHVNAVLLATRLLKGEIVRFESKEELEEVQMMIKDGVHNNHENIVVAHAVHFNKLEHARVAGTGGRLQGKCFNCCKLGHDKGHCPNPQAPEAERQAAHQEWKEMIKQKKSASSANAIPAFAPIDEAERRPLNAKLVAGTYEILANTDKNSLLHNPALQLDSNPGYGMTQRRLMQEKLSNFLPQPQQSPSTRNSASL